MSEKDLEVSSSHFYTPGAQKSKLLSIMVPIATKSDHMMTEILSVWPADGLFSDHHGLPL